MKVTFYGHACLRADGPKGSVLFDPWLSPEGIFFGSWHPFPENAHLADAALDGITDICISHNHADHFDPPTLRLALEGNERRVHIARFATPWFAERARRILGELGDRIIEHEPMVPFETGGLEVFFCPEESPGQIDSAMVFQDDTARVVNLNDARLGTKQLESIRDGAGERTIVLALQASGASEYPVNYLYDAEDMHRRKLEKRRLKFDASEKIFDLVRPERVLFFAGPPVFLDPALDRYNDGGDDSVFPDQRAILEHFSTARPDLAARSWFVVPGEVLGDDVLWSEADFSAERLTPYADKASYVEGYRDRRREWLGLPAKEVPDRDALLAHFEHMANLSPWVSARIGGEVEFVISGSDGDARFTVDFGARSARAGAAEKPLYVLTVPAACVESILADEATWDDAFLSLRMTFDERTTRFVAHLKSLLKYMDPVMLTKLEAYEERLAAASGEDQTMDVEHDGTVYRIQRFCPHAGVDLVKHGKVNDDGTITCMAHRFCFDLESGECLNAEGFRLRTESNA